MAGSPRVDDAGGVFRRFQFGAHRPYVAAVGEAAEKHRITGRCVGERRGRAEHHPFVGEHHLIALINPQQQCVIPTGDRGVDIGAQVVGPIGADAGQRGHVAQLKAQRARSSTVASRT